MKGELEQRALEIKTQESTIEFLEESVTKLRRENMVSIEVECIERH